MRASLATQNCLLCILAERLAEGSIWISLDTLTLGDCAI